MDLDPRLHRDPELEELFAADPDLLELSRQLHAARPEPVLDPHFQARLRGRLVDAAAARRPRGLARWWRPRPLVLAGAGATLGVAMIAAVVTVTVLNPAHDSSSFVVASTAIDEEHAVDPSQVITVSFNQPMDHAAVERGLQIHPATAVRTSWNGNVLQITPVHRLTANTAYTVTIARDSARDVNGNTARADIHFSFGTAPTPAPSASPTPTPLPVLVVRSVGPVGDGAALGFTPDGALVATSAPAVTGGTSSPGPSASPSATPSPNASGSPTATPAAPPPQTVRFDDSGTATRLGPATLAVSWAPGGRSIAYLVRHGDGASVVVAAADGSHPVTLATSDEAVPALTWAGTERVLFVGGGEIRSVDLQQHVRVLPTRVHVAPGQSVVFAPGGQAAYLGPAGGQGASTGSPSASPAAATGTVVDLTTGVAHPLTGATAAAGFSADGATVTWVDGSGSTPRLDVAPTAGGDTTTVPLSLSDGDAISSPALSPDAARVAFLLSHGGSAADIRVVQVASGATIALGDGGPASTPVWSPGGDRIAFVRTTATGSTASVAAVPGVTAPTPSPDAVPPDAQSRIDAVVAAQVDGTPGELQPLLAPTVSPGALLPQEVAITRGYVVRASRAPDTGVVTAQVRLVQDPSHSNPQPAFADETLTLQSAGAGQPYLVTDVQLSAFQNEPTGPQVIRVDTTTQGSVTVIRIAFDSDLNASTVPAAIQVTTVRGRRLDATVVYDADTRSALVSVPDANPGEALRVSVGTSLQDIAGQALAQAFETRASS